MAKNTPAEVKKKMEDMKKKRAAALDQIEKKRTSVQNELITAQEEIEEATAKTDLAAYERANERKRKAQAAYDMYSHRYDQINAEEMISAKESDEILNSLLKHERGLEAALVAKVETAVNEALDAIAAYFADVETVRTVSREWVQTIRPRQEIPYHPGNYNGNLLANQLQSSLRAVLNNIENKRNYQRSIGEEVEING